MTSHNFGNRNIMKLLLFITFLKIYVLCNDVSLLVTIFLPNLFEFLTTIQEMRFFDGFSAYLYGKNNLKDVLKQKTTAVSSINGLLKSKPIIHITQKTSVLVLITHLPLIVKLSYKIYINSSVASLFKSRKWRHIVSEPLKSINQMTFWYAVVNDCHTVNERNFINVFTSPTR